VDIDCMSPTVVGLSYISFLRSYLIDLLYKDYVFLERRLTKL
jgi:hypothetical protein